MTAEEKASSVSMQKEKQMIQRLLNPQTAEHIFGNWQETIIWSCLQNIMGEVYADCAENPKSGMAILGDFCFFAGQPNKELVLYRPKLCKQDFMIMVPQNESWGNLIRECYGEKARPVMRYAIKKEKDIFDRCKLRAAIHSLKPEYTMKMIDKDCFELCRAEEWSKDLVSQFKDYEMYEELGKGVAVFKDCELVSSASTYARYRDGIEIEIDTKKEYRRRGLAYACGAGLILECLKCGLYPSWDAQNPGSVALAEKLGYHYDHEYPAYEIWGY